MGIDNIVKIAAALVIAVALTSHLPQITMAVRRAQAQLLRDSHASNWGSPDLLYHTKSTRKAALNYPRACSKSAIKSGLDSKPIDTRTIESETLRR